MINIKVILPDEQIEEIQLLLAEIIKKELTTQLTDNSSGSPYLNKKQTCHFLGISNNTLDTWISRGIPTIKIGKTVRFDKNEIHKWIKGLEK